VNYAYDFGDSWEHRILLKEITPQEQDARYPICVGGERACPPEDCGGICGYQTLLEAINDPLHEQHKTLLNWLGTDFDPEHFDPADISYASLCIVGRICNERRLLGFINHLLTLVLAATNRAVGSSTESRSDSGRRKRPR
jgi:pRiA4b ORF-3-like protein